MRIREYTDADLVAIKKLPEDPRFKMPRLDHPWMVIRRVLADENDRPRMAAFGRIHVNALLFVDHSWGSPEERLEAIRILQEDMIERAGEMGLDIATTQAEGRFAERLRELGWHRAWGELYYHDIQSHKPSSRS